jgi:hypothetical protein
MPVLYEKEGTINNTDRTNGQEQLFGAYERFLVDK